MQMLWVEWETLDGFLQKYSLHSFEDKNKMLKIPLRLFRGTCIYPFTSYTEVKPLTCVIINKFSEMTSWNEFTTKKLSNDNHILSFETMIIF